MNLEQALKKAAKKVWKELSPVSYKGTHKIFEVREEALTTMALKQLIEANCPEIEHIEMIPGCEESIKGYDFELVIGSKRKRKFVRLFIQAKKLNGKTTNSDYREINFEQNKTLLTYSKSETSLAAYAFFNHLTDADGDLMHRYNSGTPYDKKALGITICSAYSVKMLQKRKFDDYHYHHSAIRNINLYSLRYFARLFYFHRGSRSHLSIPFHELAYFSIDLAERINRLYREIKMRSRTNLLLLFFPGLDDFLNSDNDLIPIINRDKESLLSDFRNRKADESPDNPYRPQALIIINTDNRERDIKG